MADYPGSGGTRYKSVRTGLRLQPDIPFLASEKYTVKRTGATFKAQTPGTGTSEVQSLASSGASAGTFTLTWGGQTTPALPYTATAAAVQTALQNLTSVGSGGITASGGPANTTAIVLTFAGSLANQNQPLVQINKAGLTGGASAAVTETTRGQLPGVVEIKKGTFVHPDPANPGYYKVWATGETIVTDGSVPISGFIMESINVGQGDVTEGILIAGSILGPRVQPNPLPSAVLTAIAGRITIQ